MVQIYDDYVEMLVNKTKKKVTEGEDSLRKKVIILDSYDGAEHRKTQSKKVSIVSFSSQLISKNSIRLGMSPASSHNILTWQQMIGSETSQNLFPVLEPIYERKKHMLETAPVCLNGCDVSFYNLHDGKMLYLLTAHSLHNRRHHPFYFASVNSQGCINENHECVLIPHEKQSDHWDRSKRRWERRTSADQIVSKGPYTVKKHMDWIDENNFGISHFGLHPSLLRRDNIRFDIFHLWCSITRRLMGNLQKFVLKQSTELMQCFSNLLLNFWTDYHLLCWNLEKQFTSFIELS